MNLSRRISTAFLYTSLVVFAVVNAQAATVNIANPGSAGVFFGYGTAVSNNNVVNGDATGTGRGSSGLLDPTNAGTTVIGGATAVVQSTAPLYTVTYYLAGSESGDQISFTSPLGTFTEGANIPDNSNNNVPGSGSPQVGPQLLGTTGVQSAQNLSFSFHDDTNNTGVANGSNNTANSGLPNMLFSYLQFISPGVWNLTSTATDWFLLGFNDSGSPDEDHDDLMIVGNITAVPIPAALGLFAGGLGLMGFLGRRRKRQSSADLAWRNLL